MKKIEFAEPNCNEYVKKLTAEIVAAYKDAPYYHREYKDLIFKWMIPAPIKKEVKTNEQGLFNGQFNERP